MLIATQKGWKRGFRVVLGGWTRLRTTAVDASTNAGTLVLAAAHGGKDGQVSMACKSSKSLAEILAIIFPLFKGHIHFHCCQLASSFSLLPVALSLNEKLKRRLGSLLLVW
jgi:hypothetical protein